MRVGSQPDSVASRRSRHGLVATRGTTTNQHVAGTARRAQSSQHGVALCERRVVTSRQPGIDGSTPALKAHPRFLCQSSTQTCEPLQGYAGANELVARVHLRVMAQPDSPAQPPVGESNANPAPRAHVTAYVGPSGWTTSALSLGHLSSVATS